MHQAQSDQVGGSSGTYLALTIPRLSTCLCPVACSGGLGCLRSTCPPRRGHVDAILSRECLRQPASFLAGDYVPIKWEQIEAETRCFQRGVSVIQLHVYDSLASTHGGQRKRKCCHRRSGSTTEEISWALPLPKRTGRGRERNFHPTRVPWTLCGLCRFALHIWTASLSTPQSQPQQLGSTPSNLV